ncbi:hypothetical protein H6784_03315 [Candidatus Nomurabacteria bacterium]|nr:hypothetical protein [Candidatus Kaiserbacteria bacterium]MCB9811142.1 hypothetical protein [Candidatus Nomurabacteria bacterium]MCB9814422.1 hypothetical protein [Candidatus Nomurabacteria bacterium]
MKKIIIVFILVLSFSFPLATIEAATTDSELAYRELALELIAQLQKQIVVLQAQLKKQKELESEKFLGEFTKSVEVVSNYDVGSGQGSLNITNVKHWKYFDRVVELFPLEYRDRIERFVVFSDSDRGIDAYVETIPPHHVSWLFGANEEVIDDVDSNANTELIVHEFAHVLSYDEMLGVPLPVDAQCDKYFAEKGCPFENSYIADFVEKFWSTEDLSRATIFANSDDSFEKAYQYYKNHRNEYVTDYAALSPEEDFSETFTDFVLLTRPSGDMVKNQKVNFFYQYPDLLRIRNEIRVSR